MIYDHLKGRGADGERGASWFWSLLQLWIIFPLIHLAPLDKGRVREFVCAQACLWCTWRELRGRSWQTNGSVLTKLEDGKFGLCCTGWNASVRTGKNHILITLYFISVFFFNPSLQTSSSPSTSPLNTELPPHLPFSVLESDCLFSQIVVHSLLALSVSFLNPSHPRSLIWPLCHLLYLICSLSLKPRFLLSVMSLTLFCCSLKKTKTNPNNPPKTKIIHIFRFFDIWYCMIVVQERYVMRSGEDRCAHLETYVCGYTTVVCTLKCCRPARDVINVLLASSLLHTQPVITSFTHYPKFVSVWAAADYLGCLCLKFSFHTCLLAFFSPFFLISGHRHKVVSTRSLTVVAPPTKIPFCQATLA